jgi:hypothetical protein
MPGSVSKTLIVFAALLFLPLTVAKAEVRPVNPTHFLSAHSAEIDASPDAVWKRLIAPNDWWNPIHSWFGSSSNFYLDAQAGGCFCEIAQKKDQDDKLVTAASVEHMHVIFAEPSKVLRMQGALGPLQSEAVIGTLTVAIAARPDKPGSKISFTYVVSGHSRFPADRIAAAVDKVLAEQFANLVKPFAKLGGEPPLLPTQPAEEGASKDAASKDAVTPGDAKLDLGDIEKKAGDETKAEGPVLGNPAVTEPRA